MPKYMATDGTASDVAPLDCGHPLTPADVRPPARPIDTGYATERDTGRRICYACADAQQVAALLTEPVVTAYLSDSGRRVTTWTGGTLGSMSHLHTSQAARKTYVKVTDVHGQRWHGQGPAESGTYVTLRRSKA